MAYKRQHWVKGANVCMEAGFSFILKLQLSVDEGIPLKCDIV